MGILTMMEIYRSYLGNEPVFRCGIRINDERGESNMVIGNIPLFTDSCESRVVNRRVGNPDGLTDWNLPKSISEGRVDYRVYTIGLIIHIIGQRHGSGDPTPCGGNPGPACWGIGDIILGISPLGFNTAGLGARSIAP